jgi:hypothetical protein
MTHDAVTHDVVLARGDGSTRKFRVYGRPMPGSGDTITLPVDGQVIRARVTVTRLGQPDGISRSRMAEMLEVDKAGPILRC